MLELVLLAQATSGDGLPSWVLPAFNVGAVGVGFYLFLTRRLRTPEESEGRLKDQHDAYEARIADLKFAHDREIAAIEARAAQERERADRNETKLGQAQELLAREMIPAMTQGTAAIERSNDLWSKRIEGAP